MRHSVGWAGLCDRTFFGTLGGYLVESAMSENTRVEEVFFILVMAAILVGFAAATFHLGGWLSWIPMAGCAAMLFIKMKKGDRSSFPSTATPREWALTEQAALVKAVGRRQTRKGIQIRL